MSCNDHTRDITRGLAARKKTEEEYRDVEAPLGSRNFGHAARVLIPCRAPSHLTIRLLPLGKFAAHDGSNVMAWHGMLCYDRAWRLPSGQGEGGSLDDDDDDDCWAGAGTKEGRTLKGAKVWQGARLRLSSDRRLKNEELHKSLQKVAGSEARARLQHARSSKRPKGHTLPPYDFKGEKEATAKVHPSNFWGDLHRPYWGLIVHPFQEGLGEYPHPHPPSGKGVNDGEEKAKEKTKRHPSGKVAISEFVVIVTVSTAASSATEAPDVRVRIRAFVPGPKEETGEEGVHGTWGSVSPTLA
ncbi:hypothetical protein AXG93_4295s1750 [Marchantia polymorpha subsp. ruderalis]|uniref:Uncharacterized protein n=1 Tax=Marchantia polymorpha subsp. ruderalis TaxID=1480154 RepID=A0A176WAX7_MARPO|nr:hypothetical protein AXG93_4295s1750 [Marchantia polymorpha subsp. ruderalis]